MQNKIIVPVIARFDVSGVTPLSMEWEDGTVYEIDRVLDVRPAASLKAGGFGTRYTCVICGKERYLWRDEDIWFVEGKNK